MAKIKVENVKHPGSTRTLDGAKYEAMKRAYLQVLPASPPGLTVAQIRERLDPQLSQEHFPGGATAGWWAKAVQLDLEAKGVITRIDVSPLRLHRS